MGTTLIITSILILKLKSESNPAKANTSEEQVLVQKNAHLSNNYSIIDTYKLIWKILFIKPIRIWIILMITHRFAFSVESSFNIKLVEKGVAREKLSSIGAILSPFLSWLPILLIDLINRVGSLNLFRRFFFLKITSIASFGLFLYFLSHCADQELTIAFYVILALWKLVDGFLSTATSISLGSFNAQISDRLISGIYMTFLSFWPNLGANISRTSILFVINLITFKKCEENSNFKNGNNRTFVEGDSNVGKNCEVLFEPVYLLIVCSCLFAVAWLLLSRKYFKQIQNLPKSEWEVKLEN